MHTAASERVRLHMDAFIEQARMVNARGQAYMHAKASRRVCSCSAGAQLSIMLNNVQLRACVVWIRADTSTPTFLMVKVFVIWSTVGVVCPLDLLVSIQRVRISILTDCVLIPCWDDLRY